VAWSTREIAELAGTTLRTVRHYHDVGLLPEPERHPNGYKQYRVAHLVRILRITRLTGLGFSLSRIAALSSDESHPGDALRALDAELAATVARLQQIRVELAAYQAEPAGCRTAALSRFQTLIAEIDTSSDESSSSS
jgi:DNA-binding transcriptional MerR regulator